MTEDKNQRQKVEKKLSISYSIKPMSLTLRILRFVLIFLVSALLVITILWVSFSTLKLFPDYVPISTANDLLNILISTDGILLGFVGIIFAQLLSSNLDQQNTLFQSVLDKGDETLDKKKSLEFLDYRKHSLSLIAAATFLFLLFSIILAMSNIAKNSEFLPTDTYAIQSLLFGPVLYLMIAIVLMMVAFVALPMTPPTEKTQK